MRRAELEHVIRAAAAVAEDEEIVVVGSQAILGQFPDAPDSLLISREADVYPRNHPERTDEIDGSLGDGSYFDSTYGYYAHAVGAARPLPRPPAGRGGWCRSATPNTGGATGWCLEVHDLLLSKCVAGRERDWEFAEEALHHGLADPGSCAAERSDLPMPAGQFAAVERAVDGIFARPPRRSRNIRPSDGARSLISAVRSADGPYHVHRR